MFVCLIGAMSFVPAGFLIARHIQYLRYRREGRDFMIHRSFNKHRRLP